MMLAVGCGVLMAQETWGGLKFGMTEGEAQSALKSRATKTIRDAASEQPVGSDLYAAIQVTDVKVSDLPGKANLLFDAKTKKLAQINVSLLLDGSSMSIGSRMAYNSIIPESLSAKYGKPLIDFTCPGYGISCSAKWKDGKQVISLTILRELGPGDSLRGEIPKLIMIGYSLAAKPGDDI